MEINQNESYFVPLPDKKLIFEKISSVVYNSSDYTPIEEMKLCQCFDALGELCRFLNNELLCKKHVLNMKRASRLLELKQEKEGNKNKYTESQIDAILEDELEDEYLSIIGTQYELDTVKQKKESVAEYITCVRNFIANSRLS